MRKEISAILGFVLAVVGAVEWAVASGNGGSCSMNVHQVDAANPYPNPPEPPNPPMWVIIDCTCMGLCPDPEGFTSTCENYPVSIVDGMALVACRCVIRWPSGTIHSVQQDGPGEIDCDTVRIQDLIGQFAGHGCITHQCLLECEIQPNPNITQWMHENGLGQSFPARAARCTCP